MRSTSVFVIVDVLVLFVLLFTTYNSVSTVTVVWTDICVHSIKGRSLKSRRHWGVHPVGVAPGSEALVELEKKATWINPWL